MDKFGVFLLIFTFIAGMMAGCFLTGMLYKYDQEKAALECDYNYDYCPYCGHFLLD